MQCLLSLNRSSVDRTPHKTSLVLDPSSLKVVAFFPRGGKACTNHQVAFLLPEGDIQVLRGSNFSCLFIAALGILGPGGLEPLI